MNTYIPFTMETFVPHRDKWFKADRNSSLHRVTLYNSCGVYMVGNVYTPWKMLLSEYTFEDGTPCGTVKEEEPKVGDKVEYKKGYSSKYIGELIYILHEGIKYRYVVLDKFGWTHQVDSVELVKEQE